MTERSSLEGTQAHALLLDAAGGEAFDRLARLAALALRAPVAMLGVPQGDRLVLASQVGVPEPWAASRYVPLHATFCRHVLMAREVFTVDDAARHPLAYTVGRLENFPRVAYCGAPLLVGGQAVAVISVCDTQPRRWTSEDVDLIRDLAATALRDLELIPARRRAPQVDVQVVQVLGAPPAQPAEPAPKSEPTTQAGPAPAAESPPADTSEARGEAVPETAQRPAQPPESRVPEVRRPEARPPEVRPAEEPPARPPPAPRQRTWAGRRGPERPPAAAPSAEDEVEFRYRKLFEDSRTPLFVMASNGHLLEVNSTFADMLGRRREQLMRVSVLDLAVDADAARRLLEEFHEHGGVTDAEVALRHAGGEVRVCAVTGSLHSDADGIVLHGCVRDITQQKRAQEELLRTALHDPLTGLPNRLVFMDRLERVLQHAKRRPGHGFAVIFLDLDNFKSINDTLGHLAGDQLLAAVARRLESCVRGEDTVARIGGDEFAILLDMIGDVGAVTLVVDRIRDVLAEPFTAEGREAGATASLGIAIALDNYESAEDLLRNADTAMYRAKAAGRNSYVMFDSDMHARFIAQRRLEADLRAALERDQLTVYYQPVVQLDTGNVTGLEALVRWSHPEHGVMLPADFMPLAEQTGVVVELGWWVLREACRQLRVWQRNFPDSAGRMTMSVNLSAKQFTHPDLIPKLDEILAETQLDATYLRLDLSETVLMQNADYAAHQLRQLRERGVGICIDDFGTGYSSLRRLREFPISTLKIDRSFISGLNGDTEGREIVESIIALGRSMDIDAVAEGVETPEQLEQLRRLGTRFAQGYLFSLPLDRSAAAALLEETVARAN